MAPRRRRPKVGLGRMDAALDAMRPMGFPADAVRKSVKKLLKVYGDDGWVFIEDAAYKLLIDTMLEEPEGNQQENEMGLPQLEICSKGSHEQAASGNELCDKESTSYEHEELLPPLGTCPKGSHEQPASGNELCSSTYDEHEEPFSAPEIHGSVIYCQDSGFEDVEGHKEIGGEVGFAPAYDPQMVNVVPTDGMCRPCYGWISDDDDEGDEMVEATPSSSILTDGVTA